MRAFRASLSLNSLSNSSRSFARLSVDNWYPSGTVELVVLAWESAKGEQRGPSKAVQKKTPVKKGGRKQEFN